MTKADNKLLNDLVRDLKSAAEPKYKAAQQWFFKEGIELWGVRLGLVRKKANEYYRELTSHDKKYVFELCEALLKKNKQETGRTAWHWAEKLKKEYELRDFTVFERWLKKYVSNWAACDALCTGPLGELIVQYPQLVKKTEAWRRSRNRWVRRGAAVSLIKLVKSKQGLSEVMATADAMMMDADDMVQKGYGWLLKESSNVYPQEVWRYVMKNKGRMPRVALRYAIEKLPESKRKQAMRK